MFQLECGPQNARTSANSIVRAIYRNTVVSRRLGRYMNEYVHTDRCFKMMTKSFAVPGSILRDVFASFYECLQRLDRLQVLNIETKHAMTTTSSPRTRTSVSR